MNNLDWLCENDREQLMKLLTGGDSCEYCAFDAEYDCGNRCNWGMQIWLKTEHNDGSAPENGVSAEGGDSNDGKPDIDASGRIPAEQAAENLAGNMKRLNGILGQSFSETYRNYHELGKLGEKPSVESCGGDADTRENLEWDVGIVAADYEETAKGRNGLFLRIISLLDRQKAIAEREQAERIRQLEQVVQADKDDCAQAFADVARLTAERDRFKELLNGLEDTVENRDAIIAMLKAELADTRFERNKAQNMLADAVSYAQAIEKLTEVDDGR